MAQKYDNWGRWGADDQIGTLNEVTPDRVVAAAALVRKGRVFSLAIPLDEKGPQAGAYGRHNPHHVMLQDGGDVASGAQDYLPYIRYADDAIYMMLQCATQWDSLSHIFHHDKMYNGYDIANVTSQGTKKNSITEVADKLVGRGVLLDIARYKGRDALDPGEVITAQDLEDCAAAQDVQVGPGDFVLIRTGHLAKKRVEPGYGDYTTGDMPGLAIDSADFFCPRDVAAVIIDTMKPEPSPEETPEGMMISASHLIMLVHAGIHLGEMWDLEELAEDCADDGQYDFMLIAPPLTITGAVGSPVNPQAIK